ncbi:MAG: DNA polymerase III subunit gamma/tau [Acidobacteriota bacterium]
MTRAVEDSSPPGTEPFQVLARKYRPQVFADVAGQQPIVQTLENAISTGRITHAYLFCGTRGVGKTTMARIVAKALNCDRGPTPAPCNRCPSCREIALGHSIDVLEIDGASHNKVDDVRNLQESLTYKPVRDRYRVIIIDEVHMLSRSAFNALLKTLEEPPGHVVFVLATTEMDKIPATILSRCQQFGFRRILRKDLAEVLARIARCENLKISSGSLDLVARHAAGSLRDGLSALDQLVSFCGSEIQDDQVETVLGLLPARRLDDLLQAVASGDAAAALKVLQDAEDRGDDPSRLADTLLARFRDLSVLAAAGEKTDLVEAGEAERRELAALARAFQPDALVRLFQMAARLQDALRHSRQPRILLELTALKMVQAADLTPLAEIAASLKDSLGPAGGSGSASGRRSAPAAGPIPAPRLQPVPTGSVPPHPAGGTGSSPPGSSPADLSRLRSEVEGRRPAVAAFLEHAVGRLENSTLHLEFQPQHSFFKKSVEMPANMEALTAAARKVFGENTSVRLGLAARSTPEASGPDPSSRPAVQRQERPQALLEKAREQPAVRALQEIFGAQVTEIQPLEPDGDRSGTEADR